MKLITEVVEDIDFFELEEAEGKKSLYLEGIFLQSELKNRNGRIYPREILEKEVNRYRKIISKKIVPLVNWVIQKGL